MSVQQDEEYHVPKEKKEKKKKEEEKPKLKWTEPRNLVHLSIHLLMALAFVGALALCGAMFQQKEIMSQAYEIKIEEWKTAFNNNEKTYEDVIKGYKEKIIPTDILVLHLNPSVDPELAKIIGKHVELNAEKFNLPVNLILSIIYAESKFNPFAVSHVGAKGLMQVFPKAHKERINGSNLFHVNENIRLGCEIFREYLNNEKGDIQKTIHAYLSKNATKEELWKYKIDIFKAWSKVEMYYYLQKQEKEKEKIEKGIKIKKGK